MPTTRTPRTFTDAAGREWAVLVDIAALRRVQKGKGIQLLNMMKPGDSVAARLLDPVDLVDVLYLVCQPAAEAAGVTDEEFGRAMIGDAINDAATALIESSIDFLPAAKGEKLRAAWRAAVLSAEAALNAAFAVQAAESPAVQ